jgi:hypothetical protein
MSENTEVSERTEQTAEFVREAVSGWGVTATRKRGVTACDVIHVYSEDDHVTTNGYAKASVINTVLTEVPALEVESTADGDMAVTFSFKNE